MGAPDGHGCYTCNAGIDSECSNGPVLDESVLHSELKSGNAAIAKHEVVAHSLDCRVSDCDIQRHHDQSPRDLDDYMHTSVKRRIRRYKFDAFITGILAATFSFGAVAFTISRESAPKITLLAMGGAAVLGLIAGVWRWASIRKSRREFLGLELKVVGYDAGQFEVVGLTTEFLEALGLCAIRYKQ